MKLIFITGNKGKWQIANDVFSKYGIKLDYQKIDTPEIQTLVVEGVAEYSAKYASKKLNAAVIVSDVAYYIEGLGGFPGPFIKFINQTLTAEQILDLMKNVKDRSMVIKECLTLAIPGQEPVSFTCSLNTTIADYAAGEGSSIDKVMILDGYTEPKGLLSEEEIHEFFSKSLSTYHDMAKYIQNM